jgi:hypothetical protein
VWRSRTSERERKRENYSLQICDVSATALCSPPSNNHNSMIILSKKLTTRDIIALCDDFYSFPLEIMLDAMEVGAIHVSFIKI